MRQARPQRFVRLALVASMCLTPAPVAKAQTPDKATPPRVEDGFTTEVEGGLNVGGRNLQIWKSLRNDLAKPELCQWRYDPVILADADDSGRLRFSQPSRVNGLWQTTLDVFLDLPEINALALDAVRSRHPAVAGKVTANNVFVRPIKGLIVQPRPGFQQAFPGVVLVERVFAFGRPQSRIKLRFASPTRAELDAMVGNPDRLELDFEYSTVSVVTRKLRATVTGRQFRNTELFARLDGLGQDSVYIRRHDLRRLAEESLASLDFEAVVEDPLVLADAIVLKMITQVGERLKLDSTSFDASKLQATFDGADLRPDVITRNFNKVYSLDQDKKHFVLKTAVDTEAKASVAKVLGGEAHLKADLSTDELIDLLRQRDITADVSGTMLVAKSVDVLRVNLAQLRGDFTWNLTQVHVRDPQIATFTESLNLVDAGREASVALRQSRADVSAKEAARYKANAEAERSAFQATQWVSAEGNADAAAAEARRLDAAGHERLAVDALNRRDFTAAADAFQKARDAFALAANGYATAKVKIEPERFVQAYILARTGGDEDKECGAFIIEVYQGSQLVRRFEYGGNFGEGSEKIFQEALDGLVNGEPIRVLAKLEERPGEVDIDWVAERIAVTVRTNRGRSLSLEGSHRFQTDDGNTTKDLGTGTLH